MQKYEKQKRRKNERADPTPSRMDTDAKSYREEAIYDIDEGALFELSLMEPDDGKELPCCLCAKLHLTHYAEKNGDFQNLKHAAQFIKMAMRCHVYSQHLAGNTLERFIAAPSTPSETPSSHQSQS